MKKRAMTLGLALFCAFLLCGCQKNHAGSTCAGGGTRAGGGGRNGFAAGRTCACGARAGTRTRAICGRGGTPPFRNPDADADGRGSALCEGGGFAACAQLSCVVTEDGVRLRWGGREELFPISRRDQLQPGDAFLQDGAAYVEACLAAERFGFVSGEAEDGTTYFANS